MENNLEQGLQIGSEPVSPSDHVNTTHIDVDSAFEPFELESGSAGATIISERPEPAAHGDPDVVKFKVSYPKDFEGEKHLRQGEVYPMHKDTAAKLQELKIGKIIK